MSKIVVVGSFVMDQVAIIEKFPEVGQSVIGKTIKKFPGGKGANQCIAISRLGGDTKMIGMVGNDENGREFKKIFEEELNDSSSILTCNEPTGMGLVQLDENHDNKIVVIPGANHKFSLSDLKKFEDTIINSDYVLCQLELKLEVVENLINLCHKNNVHIILNPAPACQLDNNLLAKVDIVTPNETELACLTQMKCDSKQEIIKAGLKLISNGVKCVVCTMGSKGAIIIEKSGNKVIDAYKVNAIDTVAAGDSFNGSLAYCLSKGMTLVDSVKYSCAVAACCVRKEGAIPSIPFKDEVDNFIKEYK
ncbi:MAG: ribokinase [Anaerorhabdus sp.]